VAKNIYKIPASIARSVLDHEIALSGGGWSMKPLPVKVILFWVGSVFALFWVLSSTFLKHADFWLLALIAIWWLLATAFLGRYSAAKEMNFKSIGPLMNYLPKSSRHVVTRTSSDPVPFYSIASIDDVDEDGYISFGDGTVGQAYLVVGSASILVFAEDKIAILDRVDAFYRKIDSTVELIWLTTKEPQRVYRQLAHLELRNRALEVQDPELHELLEEQHAILTDYVGRSFNSIHQYLVVKADNLEALRKAHTVLAAEAEESALMIKQLQRLDGADSLDVLKNVYTGTR